MIRRDQGRRQAAPTAQLRRQRAERDQAVGGQGIDGRRAGTSYGEASGTDTQPVRTTRRRRRSVKRIILAGLLLLLAVVVVGGVLLWQRASAFNARVSSASSMSSALFGPLGGQERVNVLFIGFAGEAKHGGTHLADSLNILSIDPITDTTTLIPIPRDLWIQGLPELPRGGKVNEVFAVGWQKGGENEGGRAEAAVLSAVTGLKIDHWLAIDFIGFQKLVDSVGGVDITNPRAFSYTWSEGNYHAHTWDGGSFKKGRLHLDGRRALDYSRNRYTSVSVESSDFARSIRQQRVLEAVRTKLGPGGLGSFGPALAAMDALQGGLATDISAIDLFLLSGHLHADRRLELAEDKVLQAARNNRGQYVLRPIGATKLGDYAPLRAYLATELAKPIPTPTPSATATATTP
jgi:LCP family protein required for cell wall assembly